MKGSPRLSIPLLKGNAALVFDPRGIPALVFDLEGRPLPGISLLKDNAALALVSMRRPRIVFDLERISVSCNIAPKGIAVLGLVL